MQLACPRWWNHKGRIGEQCILSNNHTGPHVCKGTWERPVKAPVSMRHHGLVHTVVWFVANHDGGKVPMCLLHFACGMYVRTSNKNHKRMTTCLACAVHAKEAV